MDDKMSDIMASWGAGRNALLYGPPATGKTRLISELFHTLSQPAVAQRGILLDPSNATRPFSRPRVEITIPEPAKVVFTTFHQSYGYEDFVIGLRPEILAEGTRLRPWAGVFLDAALELADPTSPYESVVIIIDEINRGNAARIFGEFMTFLDFDYRDGGRVPLPLPLRQLTYANGQSEEIYRIGGQTAKIVEGFTCPRHIYIVATMNSVDRSAVPIDSALARRFDRIEMRPSLGVLVERWKLDELTISTPTEESWEELDPFETGYLLLDRLNVAIASDLGSEFELGHGLLTPVLASVEDESGTAVQVDEDAAWRILAKTWDEVLFPQLEDRYSGRPEQLMNLLRVDARPPVGEFAWKLRKAKGGAVQTRTLEPVRLSDLGTELIKRSFRWLTR
jgi:hypothetical protein